VQHDRLDLAGDLARSPLFLVDNPHLLQHLGGRQLRVGEEQLLEE
jgi:hypothetical protein